MPYQLNAKHLFLTYPQCDATKEQARDEFLRLLEVTHYVVAHELHKNGDHHLHVYLELGTPLRTRDPKYLDLQLNGFTYHGNYQGCRSPRNVLKYCTKEEDFVSDLDVALLLNRKSSRTDIAKKLVTEKRPLEEVIIDHPELIFGYQRLKMDILTFKEDTGEEKKPDLPEKLENPWNLELPTFRNDKKRHYWIYSREPDAGKTYLFARPLLERHRAVSVSGDFVYWDVSKDTQLLVLDDYNRARLRLDQLNQLCDGTFSFRRIYRGNLQVDRYVVIILSNKTPQELYPNYFKFILARFNEYCVDKVDNSPDYSNLPGMYL